MIDKQQALERLTALENEAKELRKIIDTSDQPAKPTAEEWMINFLNENAKKWRVKMGEDRQVWYLGDQWIFDFDLKKNILWCYCYSVWEIFYKEYGMDYSQIQELMRTTVLKAFKREGFTPYTQM